MSSPATLPAPSLLSRLSPAVPPASATSLSTSPTNPSTHDPAPHSSRRVRGTRGHGKHHAHDKDPASHQPNSADPAPAVLGSTPPTAPLAMRQKASATSSGQAGLSASVSPPVARSPASPRKPAAMHLQPLASPVKAAKADIYTSRWATPEPAGKVATHPVPAPTAAKPSPAPAVNQLTSMMSNLNTDHVPAPAATQTSGAPFAPAKPVAPTPTAAPPAPAPKVEPPKPAAAVAKPAASAAKPILGGRSRWALDTDEVPDVPESMRAVANGVSRHAPPPAEHVKPAPAPAPTPEATPAPPSAPVGKAQPGPSQSPAAPTPAPAPVEEAPAPEPSPPAPAPSTPPATSTSTLEPPPTPSSHTTGHIDWAEDDDDALPDLDDWGVDTAAPVVETPAEPAPTPAPVPNAWAPSASTSGPLNKSPRLGGPAPPSAPAPSLSASTRGGRGRGGHSGVASNRAIGVALSSALAHNERLGHNINPPLPGSKKGAKQGGKHAAASAFAPAGAAGPSGAHSPPLAKAPPPHLAASADAGAPAAVKRGGGKAGPPPGVFGRLSGLGSKPARGGRAGGAPGRAAGSGAVERGW